MIHISIPTTFNIFGLTIGTYGIFFTLAYLTSLVITQTRAKKRELDRDFIIGIFVNAVIFGILGAKLFYIMSVGKTFMNIYTFWELLLQKNGFVAYGGIVLGILSNFIWCIIRKKDFYTYFDIVMPSVAASQAVGRIGCFIDGCCYGLGAHEPHWYTVMYDNSPYMLAGIPIIPIQLVASFGDLLLCIVLIMFSNKVKTRGCTASLYMILYSIGRFIIEFFRGDLRGNVGALSTSQFISVFIFLIGAIQMIYCINREKIFNNINELKEAAKRQKRIRERQKIKEAKARKRRNRKHGRS